MIEKPIVGASSDTSNLCANSVKVVPSSNVVPLGIAPTAMLLVISDESADDEVKMTDGSSNARGIVQSFINKKKLVEAIILDVIAFGDTNKTTKQTKKGVDEEGNTYKYASYKHEFWAFKCVQLLMNLPEDYVDYFFSNYDVVPEQFNAALEALRRANSTKLYKELRQTLNHARANLSLSM